MICSRMASSSRPRFSMSSDVRWATFAFMVFMVFVSNLLGVEGRGQKGRAGLEVDVAGARGGGDAGLDLDVVTGGCRGDVAGAQVAHGALTQRNDAAEADAHPATGWH